jgi:uncharacterized protein (TIGR02466 family)
MQIGFSVPIHIVDSKLSDEFLETLKKDIYLLRDNDTGFRLSNNKGWHSTSDLFLKKEESFRGVCSTCASSIASIMKSYDENFNHEAIDARFAGWINVNPKGGSNLIHSHPNSHWSGVLYIQQPSDVTGNSGMIEFINPNQEGRDLAGLLPKNGFDPIMRIRPKAGQMVIFPSYLLHSVYPNDSDQDRITIAFNSLLLNKK